MTPLKAIGSIAWKNGKWLDGWITSISEQEGNDIFFRYQTDNMFGTMEPLIKYSKNTNRVYFLTERSFNGNITFPEYETKGYVAKLNMY